MKNSSALFATVSQTDHLGFWANQTLNARAVMDFMNLQKSDVARLAQVASASVRYDQKMPKEVQERLEEIANVCALVAEFFEGDVSKTALWFKALNPQLGNLSPRDMIRYGRYKKLLQYVVAALNDNRESAAAAPASHAAPTAASA